MRYYSHLTVIERENLLLLKKATNHNEAKNIRTKTSAWIYGGGFAI